MSNHVDEKLEALRRGVALWPEQPEHRENLAIELAQTGRVDEAVVHFEAVVRMSPQKPDVHFNYGCALLQVSRFEKSAAAFETYLKKRPHSAQALTNLGAAYIGLGRYSDAESALQRALMRDPKMVDALSNLGTVQSIRGRYDEAERSFQIGLEHGPRHVGMWVKLGWLLIRKGTWNEAQECFETALEVQPDFVRAVAGLATVYERNGDLESALEVLEAHLHRGAALPIFAQTYALVCRRLKRSERAIGVVESCLAALAPAEQESGLLHAYGDLLDALKRPAAAFGVHARANANRRQHHDVERHGQYIDALIRQFTKSNLDGMPRSGSSESPIFVVGMPRSGTSLVEQILASHSSVYGAGEQEGILSLSAKLPFILRDRRPYPDCVGALNGEKLDFLSQSYLASLPEESNGFDSVVDKMPFNFLHLGLIALLFPKARVVHVQRDPLDTCLSVFFQQLSPYYAFSTRIDWLAHYYRDYQRLMRHWEQHLPLKLVSVCYEDLVSKPELEIPQLVQACGLPMEEACSRFWENSRQVDTASYAQVRRPIYTSAVKRSAAYQNELAPLQSILDQS